MTQQASGEQHRVACKEVAEFETQPRVKLTTEVTFRKRRQRRNEADPRTVQKKLQRVVDTPLSTTATGGDVQLRVGGVPPRSRSKTSKTARSTDRAGKAAAVGDALPPNPLPPPPLRDYGGVPNNIMVVGTPPVAGAIEDKRAEMVEVNKDAGNAAVDDVKVEDTPQLAVAHLKQAIKQIEGKQARKKHKAEKVAEVLYEDEDDKAVPDVAVDNEKKKFLWNAQRYHLTYRTHIEPDLMLAHIKSKASSNEVKYWSIVQENGDKQNGYAHTHVLLWFAKRPGWKGADRFDIKDANSDDNIHPHVRQVKTDSHWHITFDEYHHKGPVKISQSKPAPKQEGLATFHDEAMEYILGFDGSWAILLRTPGRMGEYIVSKMHWAQVIYSQRRPAGAELQQLYPWQQQLVNELKRDPDDRKIIWYYDPVGGKGKTKLTRHLLCSEDAFLLNGSANDIKYAYNGERIAIFDFVRNQESVISYAAIEGIKDGQYMSGKYVPCLKMHKHPYVVVFANFFPELTKLSRDRWDIRALGADKQCLPHKVHLEDDVRIVQYDDNGHGTGLTLEEACMVPNKEAHKLQFSIISQRMMYNPPPPAEQAAPMHVEEVVEAHANE